MGHKIKVIPDFITKEDANKIIEIIKDQFNNGQMRPFKDNEAVLVAEETPDIIDFIKKYSIKSAEEHKMHNGFTENLYTCEAFANLWQKGSKSLEHVDCHDDYNFLLFTTVIYLNDNFSGGVLRFKNQSYEYFPKALDGVMFPCGGTEYPHSVSAVLDRERYTIAIWHTDRLDKADERYN
jgi:hypothetical protein